MAEPPPEFKYQAFLSYSHGDARWAAWLHHAIETYAGHKKLVGKPNKHGEPVPARLFPVFRDREELEGVPDLPARIQEALVQSRHLIVVCSPRAAASRWVNEEIRAFKALGREDRVLAFIVGGEPNASDHPESGLQECFPEALRTRFDAGGQATGERTEPGAPDAREGKDGRHNALVKIVARLLGVELDELRQRDLERRRRRWFLLSAGLMVLVLVLAGLTVYAFRQKDAAEVAQNLAVENEKLAKSNAAEARQQRDVADTQRGIAQQRQQEAERERAEAVRQRDLAEQRARIALSRQLAAAAVNDLPGAGRSGHDLPRALLLASQAVQAWPTIEARSTLLKALQASPRPMRFLRGPPGRFIGAGFSPDGKLLALRDWYGQLVLWDAERLRPLYELSQQTLPALAIRAHAFSPDGRTLAVADSRRLLLWDLAERRYRAKSRTLHQDTITALAYNGDGTQLASADKDGALVLWSAADLHAVGEPWRAPGPHPLRLAFCPGERLAVIGRERRLAIWQLPERRLVVDQQVGDGPAIPDAALAADCGTLALAGVQPLVWDVGEARPSLQAPRSGGGTREAADDTATAIALAASGQGDMALAGAELRLWHADGRLDAPLPGHTSPIGAVAFSPDGKRLASAGLADGQLILWQVDAGAMPLGRRLAPHGAAVTGLAYSPDGKHLLALDRNGSVSLWETAGYAARHRPTRWHRGGPASLGYSPDGRHMVLGSWDGGALTCLNADCQPLDKAPQAGLGGIIPANAPAVVIGFSRDSRYAALARSGHAVAFWDLRRRQRADNPVPGGDAQGISSFAYGPGRHLAWSDARGQLYLWDGRRKTRLEAAEDWRAGTPTRLLFSPDGATLLSLREDAEGDARLTLWDAHAGKRLSTLPDLRGQVGGVAFSPKGEVLAVALGNQVRLWDLAGRKALSEPLRGHGGPVSSLAFSPDGKTLASGAGEIIVWQVDPAAWQERACRMANRALSRAEWAELSGGMPYRPACREPRVAGP